LNIRPEIKNDFIKITQIIDVAFDVPDEAFMALELVEDGLRNVQGVVHYPEEFNTV
jgi:predicted N-acetyltransferase YhbS